MLLKVYSNAQCNFTMDFYTFLYILSITGLVQYY
jgi:hypothetical protein